MPAARTLKEVGREYQTLRRWSRRHVIAAAVVAPLYVASVITTLVHPSIWAGVAQAVTCLMCLIILKVGINLQGDLDRIGREAHALQPGRDGTGGGA